MQIKMYAEHPERRPQPSSMVEYGEKFQRAAANRALVSAGATPEQVLQMRKETMIGIAHELAQSNIEWVPKIIVNGNGANGTDPMQTVGLNMLMQTIEKMNSMSWGKGN